MTIRYLVAALHLIALAIGFGSVVLRAQALRNLDRGSGFRPVMVADAFWGVAALLWLATGLARAFGGLEKGTAYYLSHPLFHVKLGLFVLILVLELRPIITLTKWRGQLRRGQPVDTKQASLLARISIVEAVIVLMMVFLAAAIARGLGT